MDSSPVGLSSTPLRRPTTPPSPENGNGSGDNKPAHAVPSHFQRGFPSINIAGYEIEDNGHDPSTASPPRLASTPQGSSLLAPASLKPGLLRPDAAVMAEDDLHSAGGSTTPSPFNFQTQVISTSPVKSVCPKTLQSYACPSYSQVVNCPLTMAPYRTSASAAGIDINTVPFLPSIKYSKSRRSDRLQSYPPPSLCLQFERHGRACPVTSVSGSTGACAI